MSLFSRGSDQGQLYGSIIRSALFIELARYIAKSQEIAQDDFEMIDNMNDLVGMFGLKVPRRMTMTQFKNMTACAPALVTLAVQVQNILRYHRDAPECWKELTRIKLPPQWDRGTVVAAHDVLERNAQAYHLGYDNIPKGKYFMVNDIELNAFRAKAFELRVKQCAFFPSIDSMYQTAIPKGSLLFQGNYIGSLLGGRVPCVRIDNRLDMSMRLQERNICVAF